MAHLAIRCQPRVPLSADELEAWLEQQVDELRAAAPQAIVRLSRLTQGRPGADFDIGWLVELEFEEDGSSRQEDWLGIAIRDMRMLGLQPMLLSPCDATTTADISSQTTAIRECPA